MESDAISCLRSLAAASRTSPVVRNFVGYSSSLTMLLERKHGALQTSKLAIPNSGAVEVKVSLKH